MQGTGKLLKLPFEVKTLHWVIKIYQYYYTNVWLVACVNNISYLRV